MRQRKSRLIAGVAVAAVAGIAIGAAYAGGLFKDHAAKPAAAGVTASAPSSTTASQQGAAPSQVSTPSLSATASATPTPTSSASPASTGGYVATSAAEKNVGDFYGFADVALAANGPKTDQPGIDGEFVSKTIAATYWNATAGKPRPAATCGTKKPTVAIVTDAGSAVTVSFCEKGLLTAQAQVAVDPATKKITAISCAAGTQPSFPGTQALVQFYSSPQPKLPAPTMTYAPKSADGPEPWLNFDTATCSQYVPQTWVFYAPISTTSGDAWRFHYDGPDTNYPQVVFTDPTTGAIERTLCGSFPEIPTPNMTAAGKQAADGSPDPATLLVSRLFDSYIYERSQISSGAVPTDEMAPYFDSPADYDKALKGTGTVPFLCSSKAPDSVDTPNPPKVVGTTETITFTSVFSGGAPPGSGTAAKLGQGQVTVDLSTMKIKAITCQ